MATPHIAAEPGDFAPDVLMPGDPLRGKRIAETFLDDVRGVTDVRGILGFTGTFEGRPVSVLASGMGMPSLTIYATELTRYFGVRRIIRVGTMGGLQPDLTLGDVVVATAAHTDSAMTSGWVPTVSFSHAPSFSLLRAAVAHAESAGIPVRVGPVFSSDTFYTLGDTVATGLRQFGTLAVEMEAAALYAAGLREGFESLMVGTVTDLPGISDEAMTAVERESSFVNMATVALGALRA